MVKGRGTWHAGCPWSHKESNVTAIKQQASKEKGCLIDSVLSGLIHGNRNGGTGYTGECGRGPPHFHQRRGKPQTRRHVSRPQFCYCVTWDNWFFFSQAHVPYSLNEKVGSDPIQL